MRVFAALLVACLAVGTYGASLKLKSLLERELEVLLEKQDPPALEVCGKDKGGFLEVDLPPRLPAHAKLLAKLKNRGDAAIDLSAEDIQLITDKLEDAKEAIDEEIEAIYEWITQKEAEDIDIPDEVYEHIDKHIKDLDDLKDWLASADDILDQISQGVREVVNGVVEIIEGVGFSELLDAAGIHDKDARNDLWEKIGYFKELVKECHERRQSENHENDDLIAELRELLGRRQTGGTGRPAPCDVEVIEQIIQETAGAIPRCDPDTQAEGDGICYIPGEHDKPPKFVLHLAKTLLSRLDIKECNPPPRPIPT